MRQGRCGGRILDYKMFNIQILLKIFIHIHILRYPGPVEIRISIGLKSLLMFKQFQNVTSISYNEYCHYEVATSANDETELSHMHQVFFRSCQRKCIERMTGNGIIFTSSRLIPIPIGRLSHKIQPYPCTF